MGNRAAKLSPCFLAGGCPAGSAAAAVASEPVDEGLGHSFVFVVPDVPRLARSSSNASARILHSDDGCGGGAAFRSISGAAVSANVATPLSTAPLFQRIELACSFSASFESSSSFASIPLQPRLSGSFSGPISSDRQHFHSGPIDGGFHSGPIEHIHSSGFSSGLLDRRPSTSSSSGHNYRTLSQRVADRLADYQRRNLLRRITKCVGRAASKLTCMPPPPEANPSKEPPPSATATLTDIKGGIFPDCATEPSSNSTTIQSSGTEATNSDSIGDESDFHDGTNAHVHWAQGKAGEDRTHVIVSEVHGWVFVGIYDGFNGPDATEFLLANLYKSIQKELKGLLWDDKPQADQVLDEIPRPEIPHPKSTSSAAPASGGAVDHRAVLRALSQGLRNTEAAFLQMANKKAATNPELALMGSCVLVMVMKGEDVYLMNVGDSRAVLARRAESDLWNLVGKATQELREETLKYLESFDDEELAALQLTPDHSTSNDDELRRIRGEHPDDPAAIVNGRVKGSLKVTRAFGAGYLKQPKWNNALLGAFRIDYKGNSPYITCNPFLCYHRVGPKDKYLILSSDGLYQYFTSQEAVTQVEMFLATNPDSDPAQHLVQEVLYRAADRAGLQFNQLLDVPQGDRRKYHDDVSIIIISLEGGMWQSSCV
ncbi:probable protein phosphatase 2C 4 [Zingiber officinale]|uniref:probable protein phosphatase 2C 4 n=1 Tax=Zingiber officinale TaxID=94328 RepID=UPI001C4D8724|nr:probable protein phosphatase 2C 4 [Zingiber officinale]